MSALYCTYYQNGILKRAVLAQRQYESYSKDSSISGIQIHANQSLMEASYAQEKGLNIKPRSILLS